MKRKLLSWLLVFCMVFTMMPTAAFAAADGDGTTSCTAATTAVTMAATDFGDFSVETVSGTPADYSGDTLTLSSGTYSIGMKSGVTTTQNKIVVGANATATVTLNGVNIAGPTDEPGSPSNVNFCAFFVDKTAKLTVQLQGTNTLVSGNGRAGLEFNDAAEGAYLLIKNAEDATPGTLKVAIIQTTKSTTMATP